MQQISDDRIIQAIRDRGLDPTPDLIERTRQQVQARMATSQTPKAVQSADPTRGVAAYDAFMRSQGAALGRQPKPEEGGGFIDIVQAGGAEGMARMFRTIDFATGMDKEPGGFVEGAQKYFEGVAAAPENQPRAGEEDTFTTNLARAIGNMAAFSIPAIAGGAAGTLIGGPAGTVAGISAATLGAGAAASATGGAVEYVNAYDEVMKSTGDEELATSAGLWAGLGGLTEGLDAALPVLGKIGKVLTRADKATGGAITDGIMKFGAKRMSSAVIGGAAMNFAQETGQEVWSDAVINHFKGNPSDAKEILQSFKQYAWSMGLPSALIGGAFGGLQGKLEQIQGEEEFKKFAAARAEGRVEREGLKPVGVVEREPGTEGSEFVPSDPLFKKTQEELKAAGDAGILREVEAPKELSYLADISEKKGSRVRFVETAEGSAFRGVYDPETGDILLNVNRPDDAINFTFGHELGGHALKRLSGDSFVTFRNKVQQLDPAGLAAAEQMARERQPGIAENADLVAEEGQSYYIEEVLGPWMRSIAKNPDGAAILESIAVDDRSMFRKIGEVVLDLFNDMGASFNTRRQTLKNLLGTPDLIGSEVAAGRGLSQQKAAQLALSLHGLMEGMDAGVYQRDAHQRRVDEFRARRAKAAQETEVAVKAAQEKRARRAEVENIRAAGLREEEQRRVGEETAREAATLKDREARAAEQLRYEDTLRGYAADDERRAKRAEREQAAEKKLRELQQATEDARYQSALERYSKERELTEAQRAQFESDFVQVEGMGTAAQQRAALNEMSSPTQRKVAQESGKGTRLESKKDVAARQAEAARLEPIVQENERSEQQRRLSEERTRARAAALEQEARLATTEELGARMEAGMAEQEQTAAEREAALAEQAAEQRSGIEAQSVAEARAREQAARELNRERKVTGRTQDAWRRYEDASNAYRTGGPAEEGVGATGAVRARRVHEIAALERQNLRGDRTSHPLSYATVPELRRMLAANLADEKRAAQQAFGDERMAAAYNELQRKARDPNNPEARSARRQLERMWSNLNEDQKLTLTGAGSRRGVFRPFSTEEITDALNARELGQQGKLTDVGMGPRFSLGARNITQRDRAYLSAVAAGDMETAQRMVDEAAKAAGYTIKAFHGSPSNPFWVFDPTRRGKRTGSNSALLGFFASSERQVASEYQLTKSEIQDYHGLGLRNAEDEMARASGISVDAVWDEGEGGWIAELTKADRYEGFYKYNDGLVYDSESDALDAGIQAKEKEEELASKRLDRQMAIWENEEASLRSERTVHNLWLRLNDPLVYDFKGGTFRDKSYSKLVNEASEGGHDGVVMRNTVDAIESDTPSDVFVFFNSSQAKLSDPVTRDNAGNVIPLSQRFGESPDIRYSMGGFASFSDSLDDIRKKGDFATQSFRTTFVDYLNETKKLLEAAAKAPYQKIEAMQRTLGRRGISSARIKDEVTPRFNKLVDAMRSAGVSHGDVADFMRARVQPIAEKVVQKRRSKMDPTGTMYEAQITATEAADIMKRLKAQPNYGDIVRIVKMVDDVNQRALDINLASGKIDRDAYDKMMAQYDPAVQGMANPEGFKSFYGSLESMPERSVVDSALLDVPGIGRGVGRTGRPYRGRTGVLKGSDVELKSPVVNAFAGLQNAVIRGVKSEEQRAYAKLVKDLNDPTFAVIHDTLPTEDVVGSDGYVHRVPKGDWAEQEGWLPYIENGKWKAIEFKGANRLIAEDLKAKTVSAPIRGVSEVTRKVASLMTRLDPTFMLRNIPRDWGWAFLAGTSKYGTAFTKAMASEYKPALKDLWAVKRGGAPSGLLKQYLDAGAEISSMGFKNYEDNLADLEKALSAKDPNLATKIQNTWESWVGETNDVLENATRYAAFRAAVREGKSVGEAMLVAKEGVALNFEQTGRVGRPINSAFAFFNAGVNGTDAIIRLLTKEGDAGTRARRMAASVVGMGIAAELLNRMVSEDGDDEVPVYDNISEFEKNRNFLFMRPDGSYFKVPIPFGFNAVYAFGRNMAAYMSGARPAMAAATDSVSFAMESASPFGSGPMLQVISPTLLDPIVQWKTNETFTGSKIAPDLEQFGRQTKAPHEIFWKNTADMPKEVAGLVAEVTEVGDSGRGFIDFRPDMLEHWASSYMGGVGRAAMDLSGTIGALYKGEAPDAREAFAVRHFIGEASPYAIDKRYRDTRSEIEQVEARYKQLIEEGDRPTALRWRAANAQLFRASGTLKSIECALDKIPNTPENEERRRTIKARLVRQTGYTQE